MLVVLGILAVAAIGGIVYIYISPKSVKIQKMAALGAIILSGLAILICGIILIFGGGQPTDPYSFPVTETQSPQSTVSSNLSELILFLVVLLSIFGIIIYLGVKDQKKKTGKKPEPSRTSNRKAVPQVPFPEKTEDSDDLDFSIDDEFNLDE